MKLPNKAYGVEWVGDDEISYLPRRDGSDESLRYVKLPKWLVECIRSKVKEAKQDGKEDALQRIQEALQGK